MPQKALGEERWPPIAESLETQNGIIDREGHIIEQVKECASWYASTFPQIAEDKHIEMNNIAPISQAVVFFCLDVRLLYNKGGQGHPLVYTKNAARLSPEWQKIGDVAKSIFPRFSHQVMAYLQWVCAEKEENEWEVGQRPPVGRFTPNFRRLRFDSGANKKDRSGGDRNSSRRKRTHPNQKGSDRTRKDNTKSFEKQALRLVDDAVKKMSDNPDITEISLPPTNSFYRRLQHKHIITLGFFSESSGEGNKRAVVLLRHEKEG